MLSCGVADLIATSANGRNYKVGATFVPLLAVAHRLRYGVSNVNASEVNGAKTSSMDNVPPSAAAPTTTGVSCTSPSAILDSSIELSTLTPLEWKAYIHTLWTTADNIVCSGQKPQGVWTCEQVVECIHRRYENNTEKAFQLYPLFSRIYEVVVNGDLPSKLFEWK